MSSAATIPLDVRHLFKSLDEKLIALLESLSAEDWDKQTVAIKWKVKDVASHLLDSNLRTLSIQRDGYYGEEPVGLHDFQELVNWLNRLNADWVKATRRLSPQVLIKLHKATGSLVSDYYASLDPWEPAVFAVDWMGESECPNWVHLAREYSEKWHHQQQIREATDRPGIMNKEFFYPAMDTFFLAFPFTFKRLEAPDGTVVQARITGEAGGDWFLVRAHENWQLLKDVDLEVSARVEIPAEVSWKLFTKSVRPAEIMSQVRVAGDPDLARKVLDMVSVMA